MLCARVAGQGDVIKCLQEHQEDADMGKTCKDEVKKDELSSATGTESSLHFAGCCWAAASSSAIQNEAPAVSFYIHKVNSLVMVSPYDPILTRPR